MNLAEKSTKKIIPWLHYHVKNFFEDNDLSYLNKNITQLTYGTSCDNDRGEYRITPSHQLLSLLIKKLTTRSNLEFLSKIDPRIKNRNTLLRASIWKDEKQFYLPLHTDSAYKLFTMQIYLPQTEETGLGTSFFNEEEQFVYTLEYALNCGYFFFPNINGIKTWHSFQSPIKTQRYSFIVNIFDKDMLEKKYKTKQAFNQELKYYYELSHCW